MKSDMFIKWSMYPRQDLAFRLYCLSHVGYGYEAYIETIILLNQNDGNSIDKGTIVDCIQQITSIEKEKVADCIDSMVKGGLLKADEDGKLYSERVTRDVQERISLSEKRRSVSYKRWNSKPNAEQADNNSNASDMQLDCNCNASKSKSKSKSKSNTDVISKPSRFVPPTVDEVKAYCAEKNNGVDPQIFFEYYNDGNWKDSQGSQVKNWKQKMLANWVGKDWWKRLKASTARTGFKPEDYAEDVAKLARGESMF